MAGFLVVAFVVACAGLYYAQPSSGSDSGVLHPGDPLASRRQPAPAADTATTSTGDAVETARTVFEPLSDSAGATIATPSRPRSMDLEALRESAKRDAEDGATARALGEALIELEQFDEAIAQLTRAVELDGSDTQARAALGRAFARTGRWAESVAAYREAERFAPGDPSLAFETGLTLHRSGDAAAAIASYRRAVALDPSNPSLQMALAVSQERLQNLREAAAAYSEYLRLAPNGPDAERARVRLAQLANP